jgi:hypothetical protein
MQVEVLCPAAEDCPSSGLQDKARNRFVDNIGTKYLFIYYLKDTRLYESFYRADACACRKYKEIRNLIRWNSLNWEALAHDRAHIHFITCRSLTDHIRPRVPAKIGHMPLVQRV